MVNGKLVPNYQIATLCRPRIERWCIPSHDTLSVHGSWCQRFDCSVQRLDHPLPQQSLRIAWSQTCQRPDRLMILDFPGQAEIPEATMVATAWAYSNRCPELAQTRGLSTFLDSCLRPLISHRSARCIQHQDLHNNDALLRPECRFDSCNASGRYP